MISLTDKERLEVLGNVFTDELKVIHDYLSDIPLIKKELRSLNARLTRVESIVDEQSFDIRQIKQHLS